MSALLVLSLVLPLSLALLLASRLQRWALMLAPTAALPALILAAFPGIELQLPWLLLGTRLGVDGTGALFLLLAGLLWTAAAIYAHHYLARDSERVRFGFFFLVTMTGNLGVILALDTASFYLFFALMTFAAFGLIVHDGSREARRAGRVYLVLAVLGEMLLLIATLLIASSFGNVDLRELGPLLIDAPDRDLILGLTLIGFAIKMGAVPLHVWLPLAHPYAPTPASAVLSGIIIKAGLLGWLRFLPLGEMALPGWGALCLIVGLVSTFYAVLTGLPQARPKTVLAYSSISQMGLVTALLGIGLVAPQQWSLIATILLLFALHHGLAKGALFLGVGVTSSAGRWSGWGLVLPALALAGAPLTSGFIAKQLFKDVVHLAPGDLGGWVSVLLVLSSGATMLLMARFLYLAWPSHRDGEVSAWLWLPWLSLVTSVAWLPWWWAHDRLPGMVAESLASGVLLASLWPIVGAGILAIAVTRGWLGATFDYKVPEGDIICLFERLGRFLPVRRKGTNAEIESPLHHAPKHFDTFLPYSEQLLQRWGAVGVGLLALALGLAGLLWDRY